MKELDLKALEKAAGGANIKLEVDLLDPAEQDFADLSLVAAAYAQGDTHFSNLAHVRVKETDRVAVMKEVLEACGASVDIGPADMTVHGGRPLHGASVSSHDDHRVAMAAAVAACGCTGGVTLHGAACVSKSHPRFWDDLRSLGGC